MSESTGTGDWPPLNGKELVPDKLRGGAVLYQLGNYYPPPDDLPDDRIARERYRVVCGARRLAWDLLDPDEPELQPISIEAARAYLEAAIEGVAEIVDGLVVTPEKRDELVEMSVKYAARMKEKGARRHAGPLHSPHLSDMRAMAAIESEKATASRFRLLDDEEIENQTPADEHVEGVFPVGALVVMTGPPEALKSFVSLDLGGSVQTGEPWANRLVKKPGLVVYIVAEGRGRFGLRVAAWKRYRGIKGRVGMRFLPEAVQLMSNGDVTALLAALAELPERPVLIIVDTMARCLVGGDENSAKDVGLFIAGVDRIRRETGATVLVIHHNDKAGVRERGSSALRGAADVMMSCVADGDFVTIRCEKSKDLEYFPDIVFRKKVVLLDGMLSSLALCPASEDERHERPASDRQLTGNARKALDALRDHSDGQRGATATEWLKVADVADRSFYRVAKELCEWGFVRNNGTRYLITEKVSA